MKIYNTNLSLIIRRALGLFLYPAYLLSFLSPRNKKIWVFGYPNEKGFSDNSKYLFLYIVNNRKDKIKAIWISKNKSISKELNKKGYDAYYNKSLKGIYYVLKAKYFFVDSSSYEINYWLSGGARKIMLWHGSPFKKIGGDAAKGKYSYFSHLRGIKKLILRLLTPWGSEKKDFIVVTSRFFQKLFTRLRYKVFITGYPRNDIFFNQFKNTDLDINTISLQKIKDFKKMGRNHKIICYLPTFRDSGHSPLSDANFDFSKLERFLLSSKTIFIIKFHKAAKINKKDFQKLGSKGFLILPSEIDIYPILPHVDILITDYSSVFFDFLLIDKPIIFFPYDYKKYVSDIGFYFNYEDFTPGLKAHNFDQLVNCLKISLDGKDEFKEKRKEIRDFCFKYKDGKSSERIFQ